MRPGSYTLYAFADGVLGQFEQADIVVGGGAAVDLGELVWTPIRKGRQLWEVGIADHSAAEFKNADSYFQPGHALQYPKLFPDDVTFRIGESEPGRDWFIQHIPHDTTGSGVITPYQGVVGEGRATPFSIVFDLPDVPTGTATLRLAITGTSAKHLDVSVNGSPAAPISLGVADGVITLHQNFGIWYERELAFDASLLKQGSNELTLTVPAGPLNNGVIYDYLRLELQED